MTEKLKALWKGCPGWGKAAGITAVVLAMLAAVIWYYMSPLDRMRLYEVNAVPRDDGTLDITYHLQWEVLNDSREGPLREVRIGLANNQCTLTAAGGDVMAMSDYINGLRGKTTFVWDDGTESSQPDFHWGLNYEIVNLPGEGWLIVFQLNRNFYKGECADFWFTLHQQDMLCDGGDQVFFDFTPGWFPEMEVEQYRFTWQDDPSRILASNEDREEEGLLIWEGSLKADGYRTMKVSYDGQAFAGAKRVEWKATDFQRRSATSKNSRLKDGIGNAIRILLIVLFVLLRVFLPGNYRRGRGYGGHYGGGSGGGCACACAGCACACACAGGGRAGCSRKDFNSWRNGDQKASDLKEGSKSSPHPDQ